MCALTIFASALLVFQVQPVIGKMLLPWFGGSPAVWTACLLFFQAMLLAGYAYAHVLGRLPGTRRQAVVHTALVAAALLLLPITPSASWKPTGDENPTLQILLVLLASVGTPYLLLSATAPLIQHWYGRLLPGRSPYRLYALSNVGSLLALLSYPVLVEPFFSSPVQGALWSGGYAAYAVLLGTTLAALWKMPSPVQFSDEEPEETASVAEPAAAAPTKAERRRNKKRRDKQRDAAPTPATAVAPLTNRFPWLAPLVWFGLTALASVLLVSVTNHVCQDVAVVPFLWVVPLSLYLLTFIICFDSPRWYLRIPLATAAVLTILLLSVDVGNFDRMLADRFGIETSLADAVQGAAGQAVLNFLLLFLVAMLCHGELVRWKPPVRHLTGFYLSVAAGGALGGALVAVVCPLVFTTYYELPLAMTLGFLLAVAVILDDSRRSLSTAHWVLGGVVTLGGLYIVAQGRLLDDQGDTLAAVRNFYGTLSVQDIEQEAIGFASDDNDAPLTVVTRKGRVLYHGRILHGFQFLDDQLRDTPTTYYAQDSGVGLVLDGLPSDRPHRVGVVGLGTGTLAAYGREGDEYVFYEINPAVTDLAQRYFTYLSDSPARIEIVPGDARLSLEREPPRRFDVLVLDAFSGDAVPVHLLTREAFEVYRRHLKPGGVIAVHVSNRYLDLKPVVARIARSLALDIRLVEVYREDETTDDVAASDWLLVTADAALLESPPLREAAQKLPPFAGFPLWTDTYSNLAGILK